MNFFEDNPSLNFHLQHPDMAKIVALKEQNFTLDKGNPLAPENAEQALENYAMTLNLIGEIAGEVVAPNAHEVDVQGPHHENGRITYAPGTQQNHEAMRDAGIYGLSLPRKYNGLNMPRVSVVMAAEMISRADVGFATIWGLQDCADTIQEFGSQELKDKYLPMIYQGATCSMDLTEPDAGSDLQSVRLKATWDEASNCWRLNGVKRFITNGDADIHLVLARSEEGTTDGRGLSYFVYDKRDGGVDVRRIENKLGIKGSPTAELTYTNAPAQLVGDRKLGLIKYVMSLMNGARLGVGAQSIGLCEAAYREAVEYAATRQQFGKTIDQQAQVQDILAEMRAKTDAVRTLLYETARWVDMTSAYTEISKERTLTPEERKEFKMAQRYADILTPLVKISASEFANQCAYNCIQVHGGSGFMKEYACERLYRDARILSIYEGTSQLQVVAAVKGIGNGSYLSRIAEYDAMPVPENLEAIREQLREATKDYEKFYNWSVAEGSTAPRFDHAARRLTEGVAALIMSYLLLQDTARDARFMESLQWMVRYTRGELAKNIAFCM